MSSPTITVTPTGSDTSLANIMNLARSLVNDAQAGATGTVGEGQILVNDVDVSGFTQPFLNSAIRELYRELRNVGQPTLLKDNVLLLGVPPLNSPNNGPASPDPTVQVYIGFNGYFDGVEINATPVLPGDVITVEKVWERTSGTNNPFTSMTQPQDGLPSVLQGPKLRVWEWRNDNIWMVGSTQTNDLRLRYWCSLPTFFGDNIDYTNTFVPIIDCTDAVAYKLAVKYAKMLGAPGAGDLQNDAREQMRQLKLEHVRRMQSINYQRPAYHGGDGQNSNAGYVTGWQ